MSEKPKSSSDYCHYGSVCFAGNGMSENQESASVQSEEPSFIEISIHSERSARQSEDLRQEQMTGSIEPAEQHPATEVGSRNDEDQVQQLQVFSDSQSDVRQAVVEAPWTSAVVEQQLEMTAHAAARNEDQDNSSRHRQRACCCCISVADECWGSPPFCSAPREVGCVCVTCCFGCDVEEEDLEAHIHCVSGCHLLSEIMKKIEPCVKVRNLTLPSQADMHSRARSLARKAILQLRPAPQHPPRSPRAHLISCVICSSPRRAGPNHRSAVHSGFLSLAGPRARADEGPGG
jgi:hypothetical protein